MRHTSASLSGVKQSVLGGAEKLYQALADEWQAAQDHLLDSAHGATREDRPSPGFHPCEPADVAVTLTAPVNPDARPRD